jgi:hypothetical protein
MAGILSQASKCLYCVWPALVGGIGWWLCRIIEHKTYFGALTVGVDPVSPQGQEEFNTRRQRDKEKRHTIYWTVGIIILGYLVVLLWNTLTIKTKAAPEARVGLRPTPTITSTLSIASTFTPIPSFSPSLSPEITLTPGPTTPTQTTTPRVVYVVGPKVTVIVTVIVTRIVTAKPTKTPTPSATWTPSLTSTFTPTYTFTPTLTETTTETPTETLTETVTPESTLEP